MTIREFFIALAFAVLIFSTEAFADVSEATFTSQGSATYPPTSTETVEVFVYKPDFKFKIIGVIEARGMAGGDESLLEQLDILGKLLRKPPGEKEDIALAIKALKEEAASAGATGVIILRSQQVRVSNNATERQIRAAAIIRVDYSPPANSSCYSDSDCSNGESCSSRKGGGRECRY